MHHSSDPVQVATSTPLLRLALVLVLMLAALAGVLVTASMHVGWIALVVAVVSAPAVVVVDGRSRARAARTSVGVCTRSELAGLGSRTPRVVS